MFSRPLVIVSISGEVYWKWRFNIIGRTVSDFNNSRHAPAVIDNTVYSLARRIYIQWKLT